MKLKVSDETGAIHDALMPWAYLNGVLTAIINGHKQKDIDQLLPWNYAV